MSPIISGGGVGGGSLPAEWTVTDGSLEIQTDTSDARIKLRMDADANATIDMSVSDGGAGAKTALLNVESDGGGLAQISAIENGGGGNGATLDSRGGISLFTDPGFKGIDAWDEEGNVQRFGLLPTAGQVMIGVLTAPPDGDLAASQLALWFDDTNGAVKLMLKGKSANGTVVTGEVALT